jgi:chromosome segregation ATPase
MTFEEMEKILQTVVVNQVNHDQALAHLTAEVTRITEDIAHLTEGVTRNTENIAHLTEGVTRNTADLAHLTAEVTRITADIDQTDKGIASLLKSQNRYEENFNRLNGIVSDLVDKYVRLEEIMIENAVSHQRYEKNFEQFQDYFKTFTQFVIDFSQQTNGRLNKTDERLDRLAEAQIKTDEQIRAFVQSSLKPSPAKRGRKSSKKKGNK